DNLGDRGAVSRVNVVAGGADDGSPARRVELGDGGEERIEAYVRNTRIEEAAEPLDEPEYFDAPFAGAEYGSVNRGVERGGIAPGCQDADAFHGLRYPGNSGIAGRTWMALQNPVQTQTRIRVALKRGFALRSCPEAGAQRLSEERAAIARYRGRAGQRHRTSCPTEDRIRACFLRLALSR